MKIRNYVPGDEASQVEIYNTAASALPKFKPATVEEVKRRVRSRDFDPGLRFYAEESGRVVGYGVLHANGRASYPWCLPGYKQAAPLLFQEMSETAQRRGLGKLFAAYRGDWPTIHDFFLKNGFVLAREMVNFLMDFLELPTLSNRANAAITAVVPEDIPTLLGLMPDALRVNSPELLHQHLFKNPYFPPDALFALRNRQGGILAAGITIYDPAYANPEVVDAAMPCFRLGAFGTEGMTTKRFKGLFSFLAKSESGLPGLALDLLACAANRLRDFDDVTALAAQTASDVPALLTFYQRHFKRQGSFPVFEKIMTKDEARMTKE
jgi:hypothetical protein